METKRESTEQEAKVIRMSTLYEVRLRFSQGEKQAYTTEEITKLLDQIAMEG